MWDTAYIVRICVINEDEKNEGCISNTYCMIWLKEQQYRYLFLYTHEYELWLLTYGKL